MRWLYPWKDISPIKIMMAPAQKKPSLNWVEVFHPSIKPMIDTTIPEMSEKRMALIRMRRIVFFMALSIRLYSGWLTVIIQKINVMNRIALGVGGFEPPTPTQ